MATIRENIGNLVYSFMDRRSIVGNTLGLDENWDGDTEFVNDTHADNVTRWDDVTCAYIQKHCVRPGFLYFLVKGTKLDKIVVYPTQKTDYEHNELIAAGWCPEYTGLPVHMLDGDGKPMYDSEGNAMIDES